MRNRVKLMVTDNSTVYRSWLIGNPGKNPRFEIVRYTINAFDVKNKVLVLEPDILALGIEMPGMSSLSFLKKYLPNRPIPIIPVSSLDVKIFDALAAGAVNFVRKPDMDGHVLKEAFLFMLMAKLTTAVASQVRTFPAAPASPPSVKMPALRTSLSAKLAACQDMVIATGVSTGGAEAILEVLKQFPENMPGAVITQHMSAGFTTMYTERLNRLCKMEVREARGGGKLYPDLALLAPGGLQMKVVCIGNGYAVSCVHGEKVNKHCPSVDVLFDTISSIARNRTIGILLTGMGADGTVGFLRIQKNDAYTIGQDQDTYIVYDMPVEACKTGAVYQQSPLSSILQLVINKLTQPR